MTCYPEFTTYPEFASSCTSPGSPAVGACFANVMDLEVACCGHSLVKASRTAPPRSRGPYAFAGTTL